MIAFITGFLFFFLRFCSWIALGLIVLAIVILLVRPQLFYKWLHQFVEYLEKKDGNAAKERPNKKKAQSEPDHLKQKLNQALHQIDTIQRENKQLKEELESLRRQVRYRAVPQKETLQTHGSLSLEKKDHIERPSHPIDSRISGNKTGKVLAAKNKFAYAPTSIQPYGFNDEDWLEKEEGQPFVMREIKENVAMLSLNNNTVAHRSILSSLAYYGKIIDYENASNGQQTVTNLKVTDPGELQKQGGVWSVSKKIKIIIF